jgi:glycosyltransferase involved in cell wall biosynthesis
MRIVVGTDQWSPDVVGGSARVAASTALHLGARGHEVTVVAPRMDGLSTVERQGDVDLHRSIRRGVLPQTISDVLETWRWAVRRTRPDLLVAHQVTNAVGLLAAHPRVPLLYVFHASVPLEQRFLRRRERPIRRLSRLLLDPLLVLLEAVAVRRAATIAVLSDYSRGLLLARYPSARDRTVLVQGGVEFEAFAHGDGVQARESFAIPPDVPFVLTVRRLAPRMGVEELLRAVDVLVRKGTRLTLGIAGAGPLSGHLRDVARELQLDGHVRFFGRVHEDDLPGLYAAADLFVLPTVAYEGFGMSTVEALAAGTPVVGTTVGATPEILGPLDERLLSPTAAPEQLAATIEQALAATSPDLRARCRDYARTRYRWEVAIETWQHAVARAAST